MRIARYRLAGEPGIYHSADTGTTTGGGAAADSSDEGDQGTATTGGAAKAASTATGTTGRATDDAGGDEAVYSKSDLDRIIRQRLADEKDRERKRADEIKRKAEIEAQQKNGDWEKVAKTVEAQKDAEIAEHKAEIEALKAQIADRELSLIRERVGAKYQIPAQLIPRLRGEDEASIEADAKALVKVLGTREAPNPETGRGAGANGGGGGNMLDTFIQKRNEAAEAAPNPLAAKTG